MSHWLVPVSHQYGTRRSTSGDLFCTQITPEFAHYQRHSTLESVTNLHSNSPKPQDIQKKPQLSSLHIISTSTNQHYIYHIYTNSYTTNPHGYIYHPTIWLNFMMTDQFPFQYRYISSTPSLSNCFYLLFVTLLIFTFYMGTARNSNLLYSHIVKSWMVLPNKYSYSYFYSWIIQCHIFMNCSWNIHAHLKKTYAWIFHKRADWWLIHEHYLLEWFMNSSSHTDIAFTWIVHEQFMWIWYLCGMNYSWTFPVNSAYELITNCPGLFNVHGHSLSSFMNCLWNIYE